MIRLFLKANRWVISIWSFIVNVGFWTRYFYMYPTVLQRMKSIKLETINDVERFMGLFKWTKDNWHDWTPWTITVFAKLFKDDCDGAAVMGCWALGKIKIPARVVQIYSPDGKAGHAVCISNSNLIMTTNERVVFLLDKDNWQREVVEYHDNMFTIILDR